MEYRNLKNDELDLYVFASSTMSNIYSSVGACKWAVPKQENIKPRAKRILEGSMGIMYCVETKEFTTPFIIKSVPKDELEANIWPEEWSQPFEIIPLGNPKKTIHKDNLDILPSVRNTDKSWRLILNVSPATTFLPQKITKEDWAILIRNLT